jgi:2-iminobutanoate/2-iminopropanoate deaminase
MSKHAVRTDDAPPPGGAYSQAIVAGPLVFLAGQGPFRPGSGEKVEGAFADQARQTFANLAAVAEAAGGSLDDAVRVGVYLRDMDDFAEMNTIYREYFGEPLPARTTIQTDLPGFAIEVDAVLHVAS